MSHAASTTLCPANAHFLTKLATRIVHTVIIALLLDAFRGNFFKE